MGTFQLKWQNYETNLRNVFDKFLTARAFLDVTVVCNSLNMKVHKAVLSAASPYLQDILLNNPCPHPIIILQDLDEAGLECLIDFIYKGEVQVTPDRLSALLKCAEALRITGVIDACSRSAAIKTEAQEHGGSNDGEDPPLSRFDSGSGNQMVATTLHPVQSHHYEMVAHSDQLMPSSDDQQLHSGDMSSVETIKISNLIQRGAATILHSNANQHDTPILHASSVETAAAGSSGSSSCHKRNKRRKRSSESPSSSPTVDRLSSSAGVTMSAPAPSPWTINLEVAPSDGSVYQSEFEEMESASSRDPLPRLHSFVDDEQPEMTSDDVGTSRGDADVIHISSDLDTRSPVPHEALPGGGSGSSIDGYGNSRGVGNSSLIAAASRGGDTRLQFVCRVCGKSLCSKFKLKEHEEIHNPFRQTYSCTYCCRVYQHRTDLYRHHRKSHPDKPPPPHRRQMS